MKNLIITNGTIVADELIPQGTIVVIGDKIIFVGDEKEGNKIKKAADPNVFEIIDAEGGYIAPGLIDVHIHGSDGAELMDRTEEAIRTMAQYVVKYGTVGFMPTTVTASAEGTRQAAELIADYVGEDGEAEVLGIHLEGPYINETFKGAQYGPAIRVADLEELEDLYTILGDKLKIVTLASEVPGNEKAISWLTQRGVAVALGHSDATYDQSVEAFELGVSRVTHMYNGMRGLHHREPGVVGAALATPEIWTELIADLVHVHPGAIKVMLQAKGVDKIVLITDAVQATGLPDGEYVLGDQKIFVKDGAARLAEGNLAGSTLNLMQAVKNMVEVVGVSLVDGFKMASLNPALSVGLQGKGWIREGNDADFVLIKPDFTVQKTIIGGKVVYSRS